MCSSGRGRPRSSRASPRPALGDRTYAWPHVIRLVQYVRVPRAIQRKISRRALFARDGWRCVYCGTATGRLTLDHVVPRSKGGESIWENVVTACAPCNLRKGDRLLEDSGLHLRRRRGRPRRCSSSTWRRPRSRRSGSSTSRARPRRVSELHLRNLWRYHAGEMRDIRAGLPEQIPCSTRRSATRARVGRGRLRASCRTAPASASSCGR